MTSHRSTRDDRGAATVMALALTGLLVLLGAALSVVAAVLVAHRESQAAADLAAIAAARSVAAGTDPCGAASAVAAANGAALTGCAVDGREVRVQVVVGGPRWLGQRGDLEAEARAGPAP